MQDHSITDKKAARFRGGNEAVFTRVETRPAKCPPTPDKFPSDENPFENPVAKGTPEREHRAVLELLLETALGLGTIGPVWLGMPTPEMVGPLLALRPVLAARVQVHLETVHAEAAAMIRERVAAVSAVADALVAARSLTGAKITELVARLPPGS